LETVGLGLGPPYLPPPYLVAGRRSRLRAGQAGMPGLSKGVKLRGKIRDCDDYQEGKESSIGN